MPELENKALNDDPVARPADHTTGGDSIAALHKMSTTAGLASQDYVEINGASVAAFFLGLGSAIAYFHDVLLVVPLAGIVLGVIALRQINRSNGTQAGKALAVGGIVLSLLFAGLIGGLRATEIASTRAAQSEIAGLINQFGQHVKAGDWEQAYALYSPRFQQRVPMSEFTRQLQSFQRHPMYGTIQTIEWNQGRVQVDSAEGVQYARAMSIIQFQQADATFRQDLIFSRTGERWQIEDFPALFSPPPPE
jgi:hypothetical protein